MERFVSHPVAPFHPFRPNSMDVVFLLPTASTRISQRLCWMSDSLANAIRARIDAHRIDAHRIDAHRTGPPAIVGVQFLGRFAEKSAF